MDRGEYNITCPYIFVYKRTLFLNVKKGVREALEYRYTKAIQICPIHCHAIKQTRFYSDNYLVKVVFRSFGHFFAFKTISDFLHINVCSTS